MAKVNCYDCKYQGSVPGSAHTKCLHPEAANGINANPLMELLATFASVGRIEAFTQEGGKLNIKGHPHGIRNGWFVWPHNFDPVWLENCDGFERKLETQKPEGSK